jgi:hypothetical protein
MRGTADRLPVGHGVLIETPVKICHAGGLSEHGGFVAAGGIDGDNVCV